MNKKILAVVPARGGSKGIPRKNLIKVGGKSLTAHAAEYAANHGMITHAIVSTDDQEIAEEAVSFGLECPFMRPEKLASDSSSSLDMWKHALINAEEYYGVEFDYSVLLEPTSPLRQPEDLELAFNQMLENKCSSAVTVSPTPAHYSPHKTLTAQDNKLGFYLSDGNSYNLRQSIPQYYHRNGVAYIMTRKKLIKNETIIDDNCAAVIIDRALVNIDDMYDLELAEWLLAKE